MIRGLEIRGQEQSQITNQEFGNELHALVF